MLLREPEPTQYDVHFQLGDIPVRIHPFFWLTTILLGANVRDPVEIILWILAVMLSILIHEMGHALTFRVFGVGSHVVLYAMGGLAVPGWSRGRRRPLGPWEQIAVSLAGPLAGFAFGAFVVLVLKIAHCDVIPDFTNWRLWADIPGMHNLELFCNDLLYINVYWGAVNLLPIYPLDGGQVSQQLFTVFRPHDADRPMLILSMTAALGVILLTLSRTHDVRGSMYILILFGMLAYQNYTMLESLPPRYPWR